MRAAAALVGLEGAAACATGIGFAVAALVGHPDDRGTAVLLGGLLTLYGVGVLLVARGIARGSHWARTPAYLIQFFALVVAWYQRDTLPAVTVALGLVSVAAVVALSLEARREAA
jgi:hypothetical protein